MKHYYETSFQVQLINTINNLNKLVVLGETSCQYAGLKYIYRKRWPQLAIIFRVKRDKIYLLQSILGDEQDDFFNTKHCIALFANHFFHFPRLKTIYIYKVNSKYQCKI